MRIKHQPYFIIAITLLFICGMTGCGKHPADTQRHASPVIVEQVEDIGITRLSSPAFADLTPDEQIACYYLAQAVYYGRDIAQSQINYKSVEVRLFLEDISSNIGYGAQEKFINPFWGLMKKIWIYNGYYDLRTLHKIESPLDDRGLANLMFVALSNMGGRLGTLEEINFKRTWIAEHVIQPEVDPLLIPYTADKGIDLAGTTPLNFYRDVSLADAQAYTAHYARNSRLVSKNDRIVELVYRTGDEQYSRGPYAFYLDQIIENLELARPYLPTERTGYIDHLVRYLTTGDPEEYIAANRQRYASASPLELILGFEDRRFDPLRAKGLWTGLLFLPDAENQGQIDHLMQAVRQLLVSFPPSASPQNISWGENTCPLFPSEPPTLKAATLLSATGAHAPLCPELYYDPPPTDPAESPAQAWLFTNVIASREAGWSASHRRARSGSAGVVDTTLFAPHLARADLVVRTQVAAQMNGYPDLTVFHLSAADRTVYHLVQTLREAAVLWILTDPHFQSSDGQAPGVDATKFAQRYGLTLQHHPAGESPVQPVGPPIIKSYLDSQGIELSARPLSAAEMAQMRVQLLALAQEAKALLQQNRQEPMSAFIEKHTGVPEPMPEGDRRIPQYPIRDFAFIMPQFDAEHNSMGGIEEIHLTYPDTFEAQMYRLSEYTEQRMTHQEISQ